LSTKGVALMIFVMVVAGLMIGSFLTVVVDRVPQGNSVDSRPSRGDSCERRLDPLVIKLSTAALFVLTALRFEDTRAAIPAYCVLMAVLVAQTWIDLRTHRLPREVTNTGIILGVATLSIAAVAVDQPARIWMMILGAAIALATMWLLYALSRGGMGDGDVRLAPLLGMYLGWLNPGIVLPGLFFGFIAGAVVGVAMIACNRAGRRSAVPFGPFLALGTVVAILSDQHFVDFVLAR
jgi:leader peptidase (prepilin peptidase)/N-methyltransferase